MAFSTRLQQGFQYYQRAQSLQVPPTETMQSQRGHSELDTKLAFITSKNSFTQGNVCFLGMLERKNTFAQESTIKKWQMFYAWDLQFPFCLRLFKLSYLVGSKPVSSHHISHFQILQIEIYIIPIAAGWNHRHSFKVELFQHPLHT